MMAGTETSESPDTFRVLQQVLANHAPPLVIQKDLPDDYIVVTAKPSPFKQHKGNPMYFGQVRRGKAYVAFHLLPLYMNPTLTESVPPELRKRMQGKACFNFKSEPTPELLGQLADLTHRCVQAWTEQGWI